MNDFSLRSHASRLVRILASSVIAVAALCSAAVAQTTTFAQFVEQLGTNDFGFVNNGGASGTFNTVPGGSPVFFFYQNIASLPAALQGPQFAHLTVSTTTTEPASLGGGILTQPLNQTVTIQITRDTATPAGVGIGSRRNLLTIVIAPAALTPGITGGDGAQSATFSASTPDNAVTFSSDFMSFASTTERNMSLSFSSVSPPLALGAGGFLQTFAAAGTGTVASNPVPTAFGPTAADVSVGGRVLGGNGQGLANTEVLLTDQNGQVRVTRTSTFGHFQFTGVSIGQIVVVSVRSKKFTYAAQTISLLDSALDLTFAPSQ